MCLPSFTCTRGTECNRNCAARLLLTRHVCMYGWMYVRMYACVYMYIGSAYPPNMLCMYSVVHISSTCYISMYSVTYISS